MNGSQRIIKRRVWVGLAAGTTSIVAWAWWVERQSLDLARQNQPTRPFVQLAGAGTSSGDRLLHEKSRLMDPTPLFFPTEWNYGRRPLEQIRQRQPGQFFASFEPKLVIPDQGIALATGEAASAPEKLSDVLAQGNEAPFAGMGQVDLRTSTLPVRSAYVNVRRVGETDTFISQSLAGIQAPRSDFAPMEFIVVVGSAGLIGDPILTSGSGWDEVDSFFRTYLAKSYHLGERLPPGRYRVVVGA